jgi:hypothetical protein
MPSTLSIMVFFRPGGKFVRRAAPPDDQIRPARVLALPLRQPALPQKIRIVAAELLQTRPRHARELQLGLLGSPRRLTALRNILHTAAGGLHHLVMRPAVFVDIPIAKPHRHVKNQFRDLKALEPAIAPMLRNLPLRLRHRRSSHSLLSTSVHFRPPCPRRPSRMRSQSTTAPAPEQALWSRRKPKNRASPARDERTSTPQSVVSPNRTPQERTIRCSTRAYPLIASLRAGPAKPPTRVLPQVSCV